MLNPRSSSAHVEPLFVRSASSRRTASRSTTAAVHAPPMRLRARVFGSMTCLGTPSAPVARSTLRPGLSPCALLLHRPASVQRTFKGTATTLWTIRATMRTT
eukprot:Amastigsp_a849050_19.p3 type:complete len:102 gc:universal Amastigsp_a849050_19:268-573(+)